MDMSSPVVPLNVRVSICGTVNVFFSKQLKSLLLRDVTDRLTPFVMLNG